MRKGFKVIHLIIIFIVIILIILGFNFLFRYINYKKNYEPFKKIEKTDSKIILNGDYLTYVNIGESYEELGAYAYINGNDVSSNISITYYKDDKQVFSVDTRFVSDYVVKYKVNNMEATRVIIVCDRERPKFKTIDTLVLTDLEAINYDVNDGVEAIDNSGKVQILCDNSLGSLPGNYSITCRAYDPYGNVSVKKRLIKVINGIKFNYDKSLKITYPKGSNYVYKYSLDGGVTFINADRITTTYVNSGSVVAVVYLEDDLIMSNTYFIN